MIEDRIAATFFIAGQTGEAKVHAVRGRERLGEPFRYEVDFSIAGVGPDDARGGTASLELVTDSEIGDSRIVHGQVAKLEGLVIPPSASGTDLRHRAHLVPVHELRLAHRYGFRIFQEMSAVDIIKKLIEEAGIEAEAVDYGGITGSYLTREYCVQYDESEWAFVSRLMEEEGIYYFFRHEIDRHVMVFVDSNGTAQDLEPKELPFDHESSIHGRSRRAWNYRTTARILPAKVTVNDYDLKKPTLDLVSSAEGSDPFGREHYHYPGRYVEPSEGTRRARVRLDAFESRRLTASAPSNAIGAAVGKKLELVNHPVVSGSFLLTGVDLRVRIEDADGNAPLSDAGAQITEAVLHLQPAEQQFRSIERTPRPRVVGIQTAMVAGPPGEELHVDDLGRVKVQFHWDRLGKSDDKASCWMRVTQGHTTGSIMIPRIGWEVLVEFVDGDPDRPVVLGKVWNPNDPPPQSLPDSKTCYAYASVSSPGSKGVNSLIMDDAAGSEKITVGAHKDFNMVAANNAMQNVGKLSAHTVVADRKLDVGANEDIAIKSDANVTIGASETLKVGGSRTVKVTGSASEETKGSMTLKVGGMENIQVGSPAAAVLQVIAAEAIAAASGAAASAAGRAQAALLGPIAPALSSARAAIGGAAQFAGPASALLGGGNPNITALGSAASALSNAPGAADAGAIAAGAVNSALGGALAKAAAGAGGGGGGGGGGPAGATGGGSGTWGVTVNGAVKESVGGAMAMSSASGVAISIGGTNTEMVGAARLELVKGGKSEITATSKVEAVGIYMVKAAQSYGVDAKAAITLAVAGVQSTKTGGGHSIAATGPVSIKTGVFSAKASGKITLACGACEVVISSSGIDIKGAGKLKIEGSTIQLDQNPLGT
jgi:type VI secretion system secreted protein VgrG